MEYRKLKTLAKYPTGKLNSNAAVEDGKYPFFTCAHDIYRIDQYSYDGEYVLLGGNNASGDFPIFYYNGKFDAYQRTYLIQPLSKDTDTKYMYYSIGLKLHQMKANASGTATKFLTQPILNNLNIEYRDIEEQNRIADILSTYDNLIENNKKRIKVLEQMAENLYKEWFVRFRFPGYEDVEFEEGIPSNWNYVKLGDIVSFERGISYSSAEINCDDGINLVNLKNIQPYGGFRRESTKKYNGRYKDSQIVKAGDLILGVTDMTQDRRTVGSVALIPSIEGVSVISADLVKIISKVPRVFLYCMCIYGFYSRYFSQFANGANVLHLRPSTLLNKQVLLPTEDLIEEFTKKILPMIETIDKINLQNDILIKQRDMLLPRLMSGKLEV